jgi:hypothetical protein
LVYVFAITPEVASAIVPETVMMPPVRPVPAVILVTVPRLVALIVTVPEEPEILIPVPAMRLVTPVLVTVTLPVELLTEIPGPAAMVLTPPPPPVEVKTAVAGSTLSPAPTVSG